jgi:hypothetical protein
MTVINKTTAFGRLIRGLTLIPGFSLLSAGAFPQQSPLPDAGVDYYQQVAEPRGLGGMVGYGRGASFVDIDGDNDDDLFVADTDGRLFGRPYGMSILYVNDGAGNFVPGEFNLNPDDFLGTWGGSFADFDNDGDPDMVVTNGGYTTDSTLSLLENRIDLRQGFVNVTRQAGMDVAVPAGEQHRWWGASWADYDNDGWLDLVVTRLRQRSLLFHNQGNGQFEEVGEQVGLQDSGRREAKNPVWIDYDEDGDQDLYIAGMDWHGFYRNDGDNFTEVTDEVFAIPLEGRSGLPAVFAASAADFDQDGHEDIYLGRWDSQDYILFSNGNGEFEQVGRANGIDTVNIGKLSDSDINPLASESRPLRMQERLNSTEGKEIDMAPFENTMGLGIGDLYDDGFPDIVIGTGDPTFNAADVIFCNLGGRQFQRCTERFIEPDSSHTMSRGHGVAFADINRDGFTEFFFNLGGHPPFDFAQGTESRETNKLFMRQTAQSPSAAWITLVGTRSNRDAIGARVRYGEKENTRYHFVRSTGGFQSQNSKTLLLQLGQQGSVPVTINWPSGTVTELVVERGQSLQVIETPPD